MNNRERPTEPYCAPRDGKRIERTSAAGRATMCDTLYVACRKPYSVGCKVKVVQEPTLADLLRMKQEKDEQGPWVPACGGTEVPFLTRTRRRLQYLWQPSTGRHAYIDCDTDILLSDEEAQLAIGIY